MKIFLWPLEIYVDFCDPVNKCSLQKVLPSMENWEQRTAVTLAAVQFKFNFWFIGKQKQTILLENNKRFGENQIFKQQLAKLTSNQQTKNQLLKVYTSLIIFSPNYSAKFIMNWKNQCRKNIHCFLFKVLTRKSAQYRFSEIPVLYS